VTSCAQAVLNYAEMLTGRPAVAPLGRRTPVEAVLLTQRDAALCASVAAAAAGAAVAARMGKVERGGSAQAGGLRRPAVVGVLGEAHLQGVLELWQGARWQGVLREAREQDAQGAAMCAAACRGARSCLGMCAWHMCISAFALL
jgi:hypothetical protein